MGFNCGIVGLPSVGKSTLFSTLTESGTTVESFPFCTIEPNSGITPIPDARLNTLAEIVKSECILPTTMKFADIAGLVAGASKGEDLGNKFPADIRETDAIAHAVRYFEGNDIIRVSNSVDPKRDIEIIDLELIFADLDSCEKQLQKVAHNAKDGDKEALAQKALLEKLTLHFIEGEPARSLSRNLDDREKRLVHSFHLLTSKPVICVTNVTEDGFESSPHLDVAKAIVEEEGTMVVPVCDEIEAGIAELEDDEKKDIFLEPLGLEEPDLGHMIRAGCDLLNLQTYFTAGVREVCARTVHVGAITPQAAGVIHTDFKKGLVCVEVVAYDDFIQFKGGQGAKEAGKQRLEGKGYIVKDDDVMHFYFNV